MILKVKDSKREPVLARNTHFMVWSVTGCAGSSVDGCLSLFCLGTPTCSRTLILHYLQSLLQDTAIGTSALQ